MLPSLKPGVLPKHNLDGFMDEYADSDVIHYLDSKIWVLSVWLSNLMCFLKTLSVLLQQEGKLLCEICKVAAHWAGIKCNVVELE